MARSDMYDTPYDDYDDSTPEMQDGLDILCDFWSVDRLNHNHTNHKEIEASLSRAAYKYTSCGIWLTLDWEWNRVLLGSIVEGSDAEFSARPIPFAEITKSNLQSTINWIEDEVANIRRLGDVTDEL